MPNGTNGGVRGKSNLTYSIAPDGIFPTAGIYEVVFYAGISKVKIRNRDVIKISLGFWQDFFKKKIKMSTC